MFSHIQLFATPWTVGHQAPLSTGFSRQEYWSGFPFPPPRDLSHMGIEPTSPASPALGSRRFTTEPQKKPPFHLSPVSPLKILSPGRENFNYTTCCILSHLQAFSHAVSCACTPSPKSSSTTLSPANVSFQSYIILPQGTSSHIQVTQPCTPKAPCNSPGLVLIAHVCSLLTSFPFFHLKCQLSAGKDHAILFVLE